MSDHDNRATDDQLANGPGMEGGIAYGPDPDLQREDREDRRRMDREDGWETR